MGVFLNRRGFSSEKKKKRQHHAACYQTGQFQKNLVTNKQYIDGSKLACKRKKMKLFENNSKVFRLETKDLYKHDQSICMHV